MSHASDLFFLLVVISVVLAILVIAVVVIRTLHRRWQNSGAGAGGEPFTLQDLRDMRAGGQISEQEFEAMRAGLIGRATAPKPAVQPKQRMEPPEPGGDVDPTSLL